MCERRRDMEMIENEGRGKKLKKGGIKFEKKKVKG